MPTTASPQLDPRSIVTPDAFEVADALLGTRLAPPSKRLAALAIDLVVIGVVTAVTRSFALVLGVVAAVFFIRAGLKRTPVEGSVFGRAMQLSVGCLGLIIALTTAVVWSSCGVDFDRGGEDDVPSVANARGAGGAVGRVLAVLAEAGMVDAFEGAETIEEAEAAARTLIEGADELGVDRDDLRTILTSAVPEDATWTEQADEMLGRLLAEGRPAEPAGAEAGDTGALASTMREEVREATVEEALDAYAVALRADTSEAEARARLDALRAHLAGALASDTIAELEARVRSMEREGRLQAEDLERAQEALTEASSGGLFNWLRTFVDELGFGFGWASLYLTVFLSWWNGQTVGKRLLGLRVVRLDGKPITWWIAFERAGGYAAGFATGLLGFAQVFWDSNRQAIHDRIVGTVVVLDKAERIRDWESAL